MIRHVSSIAEVVDDVDAAVQFYRDVLSLPVGDAKHWIYLYIYISFQIGQPPLRDPDRRTAVRQCRARNCGPSTP